MTQRSADKKPAHPGAVLREDVVPALGMTQGQFAESLGVGRQTVAELLNERRGMSPEMAVRLEKVLGSSAESWLQMQMALDLWEARQQAEKFAGLRPIGKERSKKE